MPTYEYVCDGCGHEYERFQSITSSPDRTCPKCGKRKVRRKIGIGAGVLFKGTGFYETDYRSDGYSKAAEADRKSSESPKADATKKDGGDAPKPAESGTKAADPPKKTEAAKPAASTPKEPRVKALHPSREGRGQGNLRRSKPAPRASRRKGLAMKRLIVVLALALVVLVVGVVFSIDAIARVGIEVVGSKVLGVATTVDSVRLGLLSNRSSVHGLKVANPTGYTDPIFLDLGNASLTARLGELTAEKTTIRNITISDLVLTLEQDASGKLNAQRISDNLPNTDAPAKSEPKPAGPARDIVVKELRIERVSVRLRNLVGGRQGVVDAKLPDIVLKDVHSDGSVDVLASELSGVVISSVLQATVTANIEGLSSAVSDGLRDTLKDMVGDLPADLRGPVESLRGGVGEALDKAGENIQKGVGSALQGLFGDKPTSK
jgi:putative FmdB family regulatory protein